MKACWTIVMLAALVLAAGCKPKEPAQADKPGAGAQTEKPAPPPDLTKIQVDVKNKTIAVEGYFCLREGILDYFAVVAGGHEYESVLALNAKAWVLHADLLAVGGVPGPTAEMLEQIKKNPPEGGKVPERAGTRFRVTVEWEADGKPVSVPAAKLLINRKTQKEADDVAFVFTGSYFAKDPDTGKDVYMAEVDQDLLAVFWAPSAVMNFEKDLGNAYDGMDTGYAVNKDLVPRPGTPCKVIISFWDKPAEPAK